MKTKILLAMLLASISSFAWVSASEATPTFSLNEVKVVDQDTLTISFNKDVLEDTSLFEFLLTPKSDDTREIALTGVTLSSAMEVSVDTMEALSPAQEYNLVVVFASDKEGNVIENGVDGMVTFSTPATFDTSAPVTGELNVAPSEEVSTPEAMPSAEPTALEQPVSDVGTTETGAVTTDVAAANAEALPQTGPAEMLFVVLALLLGLGITFIRKNA